MKRLLLCAAAVAAQALVMAGVPASATPDNAPSPAARSLDAPGVAAHLGISVEEAQRRLDLQDATGRLEQLVAKQWPATFAGLWIDQADGASVNVAFTRDADANVASLKSTFAYPASLRARNASRTLTDLTALQRRMGGDRELVHAGRLPALPGIAGGEYVLDVDVTRNEVVVTTPGATDDTWAAFAARYGDAVRVERGPIGESSACTTSACRHALRSGLRVTDAAGAGCSLAFTVYDRSYNRLTMSAAHCGGSSDNGGARYHENVQYGTVVSQKFGNSEVDAEWHTVDRNGFYAGGWILVPGSTETRAFTTWGTYGGLSVGATVCKTGNTTQYSCGTVSSKTHSPSSTVMTNGYNFIKSNVCSGKGDSGSGVYIGGQGEGIISGGTDVSCSTTGFYTYFGHIEFALVALGVWNTVAGSSEPTPDMSTISNAKNMTTKVTANFNKPVRCSTVQAGDFTARIGAVNTTVTAVDCGLNIDSNKTVVLTLGTTLLTGQTLYVTALTSMTDSAGKATMSNTRSTTVTS